MATVTHTFTMNGVNLLQLGMKQTKDGCVYPACCMHMSYNLRRRFAEMTSPYQPAGGCLMNPFEWENQLKARGFNTHFVWHLICDARDYMGVPLQNNIPVKMAWVNFAEKGRTDRSPPIDKVLRMLDEHKTLIGVLELRENYIPGVPYLLNMDDIRVGEHAVVLLAYREVKDGDELSAQVPAGGYFTVQDSNAVNEENPYGFGLVARDTLIEAYVAIPEFPYFNL